MEFKLKFLLKLFEFFYFNVHIFSDTLNLAIFYNDACKINEFVNWCNQLAMHFAHLVHTNLRLS